MGLYFVSALLMHFADCDSRVAVLVLFPLGLLVAAVTGYILARLLRRPVLARRGSIIVFALGLLNFGVFMSLAWTVFGIRFMFAEHQHYLLPLGSLLLVLSSYLAGVLIFPGESRGRNSRSVIRAVILYGSIALGLAWGMRPDDTIPFDDQGLTTDEPPPVQERFEDGGFGVIPPPQSRWRVEDMEWLRTPKGRMTIRVNDRGGGQRETMVRSEYSGICGTTSVFPDTILEATAGVVSIDGREIHLERHGPVPGSNKRTADPHSINRWLESLADRDSAPVTYNEHYAFLLDVDDSLNAVVSNPLLFSLDPFCRMEREHMVYRGEDFGEKKKDLIVVRPRYYLPGPAEIRFDLWWGETMTREIGVDKAAVTGWNAFLRAGTYPGECLIEETTWVSDIADSLKWSLPKSATEESPGATVMLWMARRQDPRSVRLRVRLSDGSVRPCRAVELPEYYEEWLKFHYLVYYCDSPSDSIRNYLLDVPSRFTEVRIRVPELFGYPEENRGLEDVLEMRVPGVEPTSPRHSPVDTVLYRVFAAGLKARRGVPPAAWTETLHAPTIRQILDQSYPGNWYPSDGLVIIASPYAPKGIAGNFARAVRSPDRDYVDSSDLRTMKHSVYRLPTKPRP